MSDSQPKRPLCNVYIDGFNFYFGVLQNKPQWKWLNLQTFAETLRTREDLNAVKYFTALVDPKKGQSDRRERQRLYFAALQTLSKVQIIKGVFQPKTVRCAGECREQYNVPEEKKTDVNLAISMVTDAINQVVDSIVLISGDSDQEPAIQWINRYCPNVKLTVYIPVLENERDSRRNDFYKGIGVSCTPLPLDGMTAHQLPDTVLDAQGASINRPEEWKAGVSVA